MLQRLAADVQAHVGGVHDTADEVVVVGHKVGALLHDHDVGAVERKALLVVLAVQVERGLTGDEQQRVVLECALGVEREGAGRVLPVVERGLVELVVFLGRNVRAALLPDGRHGVERLEFLVVLVLGLVVVACILGLGLLTALGDHHLDGVAHVFAKATHQVLESPLGEVGVVVLALLAVDAGHVLANGEDDVRTVLRALAVLDGVTLKAVGLPHMGGLLAKGAAHHAHLGSDHKGGVEAHAELPDDVHVVTLVLSVLALELLATGVRDGAQVALQLVRRHADAVIGDGQRTRVLIERETNGQVALAHLDARVLEALEVELVHRVRSVGDQLAQKDLLVGVDGIDHEVQELLALCLKLVHACVPSLLRPCGRIHTGRHTTRFALR